MREKIIERKQPLTSDQVNYCLLHMLRNQELFDFSRQHLQPKHLGTTSEATHGLLWAAALGAAERNNWKLPDQGYDLILAMEMLSVVEASKGNILQVVADRALELLDWVFRFEEEKLNPTYYKTLIQDLIIERTVIGEITKDMDLARNVGRPLDLIKSMETYQQRIQTVLIDTANAGKTAFPMDFKPKKLGKFSTGISWLDAYMNGGQAPGEVYALLGPSGVGKTALAVMLCTETARIWNEAYGKGSIPKKKISCLFSWEQDLDRIRLRFWSYAAKIDATRLEQYVDEEIQLSTADNLQDYEKKFYVGEITDPAETEGGEVDRLSRATVELNDIVEIFDFSGADENPRQGEGGLDEVAAVLQQLVKKGYEIGVVVLDYANLCIRRYMSAHGEDPANMRHYLANYCNECRFKIALPFNCPVWAFNQLNTESNRKSPTAPMHHSYASECGAFAENAWFAFVFGTKDKTQNVAHLWCTKERRARGEKEPIVLHIEGEYSRLMDVSNDIKADPITHSFVSSDIAQRRATPDDIKARRKKLKGSDGTDNLRGNF